MLLPSLTDVKAERARRRAQCVPLDDSPEALARVLDIMIKVGLLNKRGFGAERWALIAPVLRTAGIEPSPEIDGDDDGDEGDSDNAASSQLDDGDEGDE